MARAKGLLLDFLHHEDEGSATLWNLFWLTGFIALLGVGVDTTAAMNTKAQLQSVADAASHAAVMDLFPVSGDAVATALSYARQNSPRTEGVVGDADVKLGYWDTDRRAFRTADVPYLNAVRVVARRDRARSNALATAFLRVVGFDEWQIGAVSTSTYFGDLSLIDRCRKNGVFAGGRVMFAANNLFTREYCVHGEEGFKITQNNVVTCGVELSTREPSGWMNSSVATPGGSPGACSTDYGALSNEAMIHQTFSYRSIPSRAELEYRKVREMLDAFITGELDNDPFNAVAPWLTDARQIPADAFNALARTGNLAPGTLYVVWCGGGGVLEPQGLLRNIGIYTDCRIHVGKDGGGGGGGGGGAPGGGKNGKGDDAAGGDAAADGDDVAGGDAADGDDAADGESDGVVPPALSCSDALALGYETYATYLDTAPGRTYRDGVTSDTIAEDCGVEPGASGVWDNVFVFSTAFESGDRSQTAIKLAQGLQMGRMDACTEGGGVRIYAAGSLHSPSGLTVNGSHIILLGNAHFAARLNATYGMTLEAAGDVQFAAQAKFGGCSPDERDLETDVVLTIRPVAIVN